MRRLLTAPLLLLLAAPALSQTGPAALSSKDKIILRSGHVTVCKIDKGCKEETVEGRRYLVMKTDGFILRVASGYDRRHGYADVTITNETGAIQQLNPANFRMEEAEPRLHRLSYVDPNGEQQVAVKAQREPKPEKVVIGKGLPDPSWWTSEEHEQEKKAKAVVLVNPAIPILRAGEIAPDTTVSGRVYFERPRTRNGVSVLVALPGALFEFPCNLAPEVKAARHRKEVELASAS